VLFDRPRVGAPRVQHWAMRGKIQRAPLRASVDDARALGTRALESAARVPHASPRPRGWVCGKERSTSEMT
jgi:hypothetical protein